MLCNNMERVSNALEALEREMKKRVVVSTGFGEADPSEGYSISDVSLFPGFTRICVYMLDRSVKAGDLLREGDKAFFIEQGGKVLTSEERESQAREEELKSLSREED